jgi:hypothetical protein
MGLCDPEAKTLLSVSLSGSRTFSLANLAGRRDNSTIQFPEKILGHQVTYELPYKPISA